MNETLAVESLAVELSPAESWRGVSGGKIVSGRMVRAEAVHDGVVCD